VVHKTTGKSLKNPKKKAQNPEINHKSPQMPNTVSFQEDTDAQEQVIFHRKDLEKGPTTETGRTSALDKSLSRKPPKSEDPPHASNSAGRFSG
jgi:hypothetical protein